ncbi:uncharacterized protein LOC135243556 isoform X2 [Anguilla rostrata]|uniref:uncharacterized protein LOC135243556 isoform X2 n=1 Tax=Anguilla rostrata TaxID=7938 RepID=UPI0030D18B3E
MSEPMYRDWILETIDSLRSRKARPDLERICRMVRRRHGSDPERTRSELEKLIQEQTVLKVSYKGSISYRNAAKVQRKSRKKTEHPTGFVKNQSKTTIFNNGDSAHSSTDQGEETGDAEITNAILCRDPETAPLPVAEAALVPNSGNSCISGGTVVCRSQVHCATGSDGERTNSPKEKLPQTGGSSTSPDRDKSTIHNNGSGASGMNRRAREVERGLPELERSSTKLQNKTCTSANTSGYLRQKPHAPIKAATGAVAMETESSEVSGPERPACGSLSAGERDTGACGSTVPLCQRGGETEDRGGARERPNIPGPIATTVVPGSLTPPDCPNEPKMEPIPSSSCIGPQQEVCDTERSPTAHRCLQGDAAVPQVRALCPSVQRETANGHEELRVEESAVTPDQLICDRSSTQGEVMTLTEGGEQVTSVPPDACMGCKIEVGVASCLLTPTASPRDNGMVEEGGMKRGVFVKTEKAAQSPLEWSVSDVASYFVAAGFPEQAAAFRVQEIDGKSLLLMQRNDVLTGLSIRLGPALKIYEHHVKMLQKAHFEDDSAFC